MYIYSALNTKNGKRYVGQTTVGLQQRRRQHISSVKKDTTPRTHFQNALRKYRGCFLWTILDIASTQQELDIKEQHWIQHYCSHIETFGYNKLLGGLGGRHTDETKQRISSILMGHTNTRNGKDHPNYGKPLSEEAKQNISEKNKGRKLTKETRQRMSDSRTGTTRSPETRQKISEGMKGRVSPLKGRTKEPMSDDTKRKISETKRKNKEQRENPTS